MLMSVSCVFNDHVDWIPFLTLSVQEQWSVDSFIIFSITEEIDQYRLPHDTY